MKKYLNLSLIYAIAAMVGGVFYRAGMRADTCRSVILGDVFQEGL